MHDSVVELVPAVRTKDNEEREDRDEVEHALGEHRAESVGEADRGAAGEQRRTRNVAGANRQQIAVRRNFPSSC